MHGIHLLVSFDTARRRWCITQLGGDSPLYCCAHFGDAVNRAQFEAMTSGGVVRIFNADGTLLARFAFPPPLEIG